MTARPLRVLHVEDDPDIRLIAGMALALDGGIDVRSAGSGRQALAMLDIGGWTPDLLLLDVMMPDMDGMGLAGQVRKIAGMADVPVVFLTARGRPGDQDRYRSVGSLGLIVKPFDPLTLAVQLRTLMDAPR